MKPLRLQNLPDGEIAIVLTPETAPETMAILRYSIEDPTFERIRRVVLGTAPSAESVAADAEHASARAHVLPIRGRG